MLGWVSTAADTATRIHCICWSRREGNGSYWEYFLLGIVNLGYCGGQNDWFFSELHNFIGKLQGRAAHQRIFPSISTNYTLPKHYRYGHLDAAGQRTKLYRQNGRDLTDFCSLSNDRLTQDYNVPLCQEVIQTSVTFVQWAIYHILFVRIFMKKSDNTYQPNHTCAILLKGWYSCSKHLVFLLT